MTLVSFAESLSVQLVTSYSYVLLGDPQHANRIKSGVHVHIYIYTYMWPFCVTQQSETREER